MLIRVLFESKINLFEKLTKFHFIISFRFERDIIYLRTNLCSDPILTKTGILEFERSCFKIGNTKFSSISDFTCTLCFAFDLYFTCFRKSQETQKTSAHRQFSFVLFLVFSAVISCVQGIEQLFTFLKCFAIGPFRYCVFHFGRLALFLPGMD